MKTNREMTESVLHRASQVAAQQKSARKRAAGIVTGVLCIVLIVGLIAVPWGTGQPALPTDAHIATPSTTETKPMQTTRPTQEDTVVYTGNIYFMSGTEETIRLSPMQADTTVASENLIRVRSLKALSTQERNQALTEELEFYTEFYNKHHGNADGGQYEFTRSENAIIQILSGGHSSLVLPNQENIADFTCNSTGVFTTGWANARYHADVTFGKGEETVTIPEGSYRIYLNIRFTDETGDRIHQDPDIPLSTLKDTITITIHFKDGTDAVVLIDVTLDDTGNVYLTMRGNSDM